MNILEFFVLLCECIAIGVLGNSEEGETFLNQDITFDSSSKSSSESEEGVESTYPDMISDQEASEEESEVQQDGSSDWKHLVRRGGKRGFNMIRNDYTVIVQHRTRTSARGMVCRGEKCKYYGSDKLNSLRKSGEPKWVLKVRNYHYYCFEENVHSCPKFSGVKYRRFRGKLGTSEKEMHQFQAVVCGHVYTCYAQRIKQCPEVPVVQTVWKKVDVEKVFVHKNGSLIVMCLASDIEHCHSKYGSGDWKEEANEPERIGIEWIQVSDGIKYYCTETNVEKCPKIKGSSVKGWKKFCDSGDTEECTDQWEATVNGVVIKCVSESIDDCEEDFDGDWVPSKDEGGGKNKKKPDFRFIHGGSKYSVTYFCEETNLESCPKINNKKGGWKKEKDENLEGMWQRKIKGVVVVCVTNDIKHCQKIHGGKWNGSGRFRDEDGVPENSRWELEIEDDIIAYCDARIAVNCPKLKGKGGETWKPTTKFSAAKKARPPKQLKEWEMRIKGVILVCEASDVDDCDDSFSGKWVPSHHERDEHGHPKGMHWMVVSQHTTIYCGATEGSCPLIRNGKPWFPSDSDKDEYEGDDLEVEVSVIIPDRIDVFIFDQSHESAATLLCYSKNGKECPHGFNWIKVNKNKVDKKVSHIISSINVWVKKVDHVILVCVAKDVKTCKPEGGWVIISGAQAGLWKTTKDSIDIYCETENEGGCPSEIGKWKVITKGGQLDQKELALKKKLKMWRLVTFDHTLYCDTQHSSKCPKIKGHNWHKVSSRDIKPPHPPTHPSTHPPTLPPSGGKDTRFEKNIQKTLYICKAKSKHQCPKLPFNQHWMESKGKFTLEVMLDYFKEFPEFEDACRESICKFGTEDTPLGFDNSITKRRRLRKKKQ